MELYEMTAGDTMTPVRPRSMAALGMREADLETLLAGDVARVAPGVLVIGRQTRVSPDGLERADLVGITREGDIEVLELKRGVAQSYCGLQGLLYAMHLVELTVADAIAMLGAFLRSRGDARDPQRVLFDHLGWREPREDAFARRVGVTLVASDFGPTLVTAVSRLNALAGGTAHRIRCVQVRAFPVGDRVLLSFDQRIPLPECGELLGRDARKAREAEAERARRREDGREAALHRLELADGTVERGLPLRRLVLRAAQACVAGGASVGDLLEAWGREAALFAVVPGRLSGADLQDQIVAQRAAEGRQSGERLASRFFTAPGEVLVEGDTTFALSTEWRREDAAPFLNALVVAFPGALQGWAVDDSDASDETGRS